MVAKGKNSGWLHEGVIRGSMLGKTMLPTDEELGKKDDDHHFKPARRHNGLVWGHAPRWRRKRLLLAVLGFCAVSVFLHYMPDMRAQRADGSRPSYASYVKPSADAGYDGGARPYELSEPTGPPPGIRAPRAGAPTPHTFDGAFKFYRLARSLHGAAHTDGYRKNNRNVLFAVSSLKSASTMLPLICDMSQWNRSWVHAAFLGREDIPLEDLLDINGVDRERCPAIWHDARPDYSEYSTDERAELSVQSALTHMDSFLHPQVAIMDDALSEDAFFAQGMRNKTEALGMPLIEVPKNKWEDYMWMTRLDAGSLKSWHLPTIDILVQVPPDSSSVLPLLKSIQEADYSGLALPRITLELPAELDPTVERSVEKLEWPPRKTRRSAGSQLIVRRRIANHGVTQENAAIRFLELFYPNNVDSSHVLLLSPQAQLSPQYLHYIQYLLLEYRYSSLAADDTGNLMGVSLALPSLLVDGQTKLVPPTASDMHAERYTKLYGSTVSAPFMMQAPNSDATLFFGDKWAEWHDFLSHRVSKQHKSSRTPSRAKVVSETLPSWTEYMLEFMRARGYFLLYPATTSSAALVGVHNELYHAPEEYRPSAEAEADTQDTPPPAEALDEPFLRAVSPPAAPKKGERPLVPGQRPLHRLLPFDGDLPETEQLPQLLFNGVKLDPSSVAVVAAKYADQFREEVGGCKVRLGKRRKVHVGSAADLFCFGDEGEDAWEEDWLLAADGLGSVATNTPLAAGTSKWVGVGVGVTAAATPTATSTATSAGGRGGSL
ncbi:uncharacterized protein EKO05_0009353 [Ascochyta rabiei]|uniref:Uncharacterized protein n=1 Tax=Didymella rabiei TaxID=5454 RepID=A0A163EY65_DIDRA|nr:uncharacterized protein EKO05_0009353 [Ascochyta rabiei]KZM24011.1 hypothetical protein ST47_g4924 [Ascochyta rabiei]UPX19077.1 hypothetical protein EKO05_0009353 [Ascochyta rabiei]